jgi:hypothetical protein
MFRKEQCKGLICSKRTNPKGHYVQKELFQMTIILKNDQLEGLKNDRLKGPLYVLKKDRLKGPLCSIRIGPKGHYVPNGPAQRATTLKKVLF